MQRVAGLILLVASLACRADPEPGDSTIETGTPIDTGTVVVTTSGRVTVAVLPTQLVRVTFDSDEDSRATVTATWTGGTPLRLVEADPRTAHDIELIGPPPDVDLAIEVQVDGWREVVDLRTPRVPVWIPTGDVVTPAEDPDRVGWTLTNIVNQALDWPASAVIYNHEGHPIWHFTPEPDQIDTRGDLDVRLTDEGTILIGPTARVQAPVEVTLDGTVLWTGPVLQPFLHHHFDRLDDGTYVALQQATPTDAVLVLDADHEVLWRWVAHEHLPGQIPDVTDFLHVNAVTVTDDVMYVNSYKQSTIFKVDRATGDILWRLGDGRDFELLSGEWFHNEHDPQLQDNGNWLIYDNTYDGPSRVVEVAIDEAAMTAEVVWTFPGEAPVDDWYTETWYSPIWGDADRLPWGGVRVTNGNRFIDKRSRIFDVRLDGAVVWAIDFEVDVGVYRSVPLVRRGGTIARAMRHDGG